MTYRYIYKITCTAGTFKDKFYFGQHTTDNLDDNYTGSGRKITNYIKKHPNDYVKEIIAFYNTQEELNQAEYDIILPWLNNKMCLNLKEGGGNNKLSEETKRKIGESNKGKLGPNKGKTPSLETRRKISEANKGRIPWNKGIPRSEETKQKISNTEKGKIITEEDRKKKSEAMKKYYSNPENIKKTIESRRGYKHSEETKRKIGESNKGKHTGVQTRKGAILSEETKQKIRESVLRYYESKKQN